MHLVPHLRGAPYESPAAPMSNNATDSVELGVSAVPNRFRRRPLAVLNSSVRFST